MFADENYITSCLINTYNHKVFFKRKHSVFNFMFTENRFYWSICYFIFKGYKFFLFTDSITWLFHSPKWFLWIPWYVVIWYSLNEFLNTNFYFFMSFLKTNLFWFSIIWAFRYELKKPLIINNIQIPCCNIIINNIQIPHKNYLWRNYIYYSNI